MATAGGVATSMKWRAFFSEAALVGREGGKEEDDDSSSRGREGNVFR